MLTWGFKEEIIMKLRVLAAATLAVSLLASPALADVTARDPQTVLSALGKLGYQAELKTGTDGANRISLTIDGSPSTIYFFNCDDGGANCETLFLEYGMNLDKGAAIEKVNEWNTQTIHGFVYMDKEADPWLNLTLATGEGVSDDLFASIMSVWRTRIGDVRKFFDF
jgi:hypothetical protein